MIDLPKPLARETILAMRADYTADELSVQAICEKYQVSNTTLLYWVDGGPAHGEARLAPLPRRSARRRASARGRRRPRSRLAVVRRMWRAAEAQVREIERRMHDAPPEEREQNARVLATLARTLRELSALDAAKPEPVPADDDPVPTDLDEFRRELARRIDALVASRTDGGGAGAP